jgi:hypothetical protein
MLINKSKVRASFFNASVASLFSLSLIVSPLALLFIPFLVFLKRFKLKNYIPVAFVLVIIAFFKFWPYTYTDCFDGHSEFCVGVSANFGGGLYLSFVFLLLIILHRKYNLITQIVFFYLVYIGLIIVYSLIYHPIDTGFRKLVFPFEGYLPINANTIIASAASASLLFYANGGRSLMPVIILMFASLAMQNRTGLIGVIPCLALMGGGVYGVNEYKFLSRIKSLTRMGIFCLILSLIIFAINMYAQYFVDILDRFSFDNIASDGRLQHIEEFSENIDLVSFLFGGVRNNLSAAGFHNFYLDSIANYGVISLLINLYIFFILVSNAIFRLTNIFYFCFLIIVTFSSNLFIGYNAETLFFLFIIYQEIIKSNSTIARSAIRQNTA